MMKRRLSFSFWGFAVLALLLVVMIGLCMPDQGDVQLYLRAARGTAAGKWPYSDFSLEYPPGALLAFLPPYVGALMGGDEGYFFAFALWGAFLTGIVALSLRRVLTLWKGPHAPEPTSTGRNIAALCIAMAWLITGRYDIFPATLTALSLWALFGGRAAWAGVALGVAIAAKLYPVVFAPVFFGWLLGRSEKRAALAFGLATTLTVFLCFLPFLLHSPQKLLSFVEYHRLRGIQVESGAAGIAMLLGHDNRVDLNYGAFHLDGSIPQFLLPQLTSIFPLAWLAALARTVVRFRRGASETALIECAAGTLLLFMALNKVFSPQFMIWLIPFLPLLKPRWRVWGAPLFWITTWIFPFNYNQLLSGSGVAVLLLNLRNFGVLALGLLLLWGSTRADEEAERYERPGPGRASDGTPGALCKQAHGVRRAVCRKRADRMARAHGGGNRPLAHRSRFVR